MTGRGRRTRRRFLRSSALVGATGLAGCSFEAGPVDIEVGDPGDDASDGGSVQGTDDGTGDEEATDTPSGPRGGRLAVTTGSLSTLDPVGATDGSSRHVVVNLFDGLTTLENGGTEVSMQLAESVDVSSDYRTYTFTLGDATFHDGQPVTAADFVYAWERLGASENSRQSYLLTDVLGVSHRTTTDDQGNEVYRPESMAVTAEDDRTLRVELLSPNHAALTILAHPAFSAVPEGIVGDAGGYPGKMDYQAFATETPVGAGSFVLEDWARNDEVVLARFEDYHGRPALLDGVDMTVTSDATAAYESGQREETDLPFVPDDEWDPTLLTVDRTDDRGRRFGSYGPMDNGATVDYLGVPELSTFYVGFNTDEITKPARQAVAYALNQHEIAREVFDRRSVPAYHLTPPATFPGRNYESHLDSYPYGVDEKKLAKAREVMEDAGYGPSNRYEITVTTFQSLAWREVGQYLQDGLASAHIDLKYHETSFGDLVYRGRQGNLAGYVLGDAPGPAVRPDDVLARLDPPNTDTDRSDSDGMYVNWRGTRASSRAESAYDVVEGNQEPTKAARRAREDAYVDMEEANWDDVAVLPVVHGMAERFAYDWVDVPPFGALGPDRQLLNTTSLVDRDA